MANVRIKVCGITNVDDALAAARLGVDAIGLNFCTASKRFVSVTVVESILDALPPFVDPVALFVNEPLAVIAGIVRQLRKLRTIQWHGDNPEIPPTAANYCYVPAFAIAGENDFAKVEAFLERCRGAGRPPAAVLLDGHAAGQYGGTGQTAPWRLLAEFQLGVPVVLAGGLTPQNVAEAIRTVRPYAVDVASGVESEPGVKDAEKIRRFVDAARGA
jgi:phosphoribosylanthranilate isomerase